MWPFRKRTSLADSGIFRGFTDWHCHLLPGVDDGVQTMEETLRILSLYEDLKVKEIWLTPHIMEDIPNTTAALKARLEELRAAYQGNITLHLASENMLDTLFEERLNKNDLLPFGKRRETSISGDLLLQSSNGTEQYSAPHQDKRICPRIGAPRTVCVYG